ncbi:MAG: hypothetical protein BMS9Abin15_0126 [Gammaproteobacteria bacterium]|nr:MAG: hypothetical protein BMS9Abin15_0126 [Gammaproteobacteria bacterium]
MTLADPIVHQAMLETIREAFRQGGQGAAWEFTLFTRPWYIDPSDIPVNALLWHGTLDRTVPVALGKQLAASIPGCSAIFTANDGHFSLPVVRRTSIFQALIAG